MDPGGHGQDADAGIAADVQVGTDPGDAGCDTLWCYDCGCKCQDGREFPAQACVNMCVGPPYFSSLCVARCLELCGGQDVIGPGDPGAPDVPEAIPDSASDLLTDTAFDTRPDSALDATLDSAQLDVPDVGVIQCGKFPYVFPSFDNACAIDTDCALALHQTDCCGSRVALGIDAGLQAAFDAAEKVCEAQYPACGCVGGPITADDGGKTYNQALVGVACKDHVCSTFVGDPCGVAMGFQSADACGLDSDCVAVFHQTDCCGTQAAWGIQKTQTGAFATAEQACDATYGGCGCPSGPTVAQDGNSSFGADNFGASCDAGHCRSFVKGTTPQ